MDWSCTGKGISLLGVTMVYHLVTTPSFATDETQRIYKSAQYLTRGDTGIAIADGIEAIHYNPAGIATGKGIYKETVLGSPMIEFSANTKDLIRKFALENKTGAEPLAAEIGKNQHLGIYNISGLAFRRAALGATISNQTNLLPALDPEGGGLPIVSAGSYTNQVLHFTLAEQFFSKNFSMGTTVKYITRNTAELEVAIAEANDLEIDGEELVNTGTATAADLGLMFKTSSKRSPFSLGLTVQNVGDASFKGLEETDKVAKLKQTVNLGLAIEPGTRFSKFRFLLDVRDLGSTTDKNGFKKIHIGSEITIRKFLGLGAGLNQGYPSFGAHLNLYVIRFDIGAYTQEVGARVGERPDTRYFMRITAGF